MLWLLEEDVAASMMAAWLQRTPQQVEEQVRGMEGILVPVAQFKGGPCWCERYSSCQTSQQKLIRRGASTWGHMLAAGQWCGDRQ